LAGIYIHIPFCKQACTYCNFHFSVSLKNKTAFIEALIKEINTKQDFITDKNIETIYLGGGTPSILSIDELNDIFDALKNNFSISKNAEITLEANPDDITKSSLADLKKAGINRLSVGLQSFNEAELKWMNRAHNAAQSLQCLDDIAAAGFDNYSVDLIYGSALQTDEDLKNNFNIIAERNVPHISCYALTVENGTLLNKLIKENKSPDIDTEKQAAHFYLLLDMMKANGYEQYEISNFSKPNYRSKHNSSYWKSKPYFGFGPSAHSYNGTNTRRWNIANNGLYIQSIEKNIIPFEEEILTLKDCINEFVMISLRTEEGVDLTVFDEKFGLLEIFRILKTAEKFIQQNKIEIVDNHVKLTNEGKFFADGIAGDLFC
jgi:oxygen-independent coproporphyrinogen III oxidase